MQVNVVGTVMLVISILIVVGGEMRNRARQRALAGRSRPTAGHAWPMPLLASAWTPRWSVCPDRAVGSPVHRRFRRFSAVATPGSERSGSAV